MKNTMLKLLAVILVLSMLFTSAFSALVMAEDTVAEETVDDTTGDDTTGDDTTGDDTTGDDTTGDDTTGDDTTGDDTTGDDTTGDDTTGDDTTGDDTTGDDTNDDTTGDDTTNDDNTAGDKPVDGDNTTQPVITPKINAPATIKYAEQIVVTLEGIRSQDLVYGGKDFIAVRELSENEVLITLVGIVNGDEIDFIPEGGYITISDKVSGTGISIQVVE